MENSEYLRGITDGYGARVVIHPQGTVPYPHDHGFFISTSTETNVALRMVCLSVCAYHVMLERCNCYTSKMEEIIIMSQKERDYKLCKTKEDIKCQAEAEEDIRLRSGSCFENCFSPCVEKQYVKSISQRQWPTEDYTMILIQSVCEKKSQHPAYVDYCRLLLRQDARQRSLQFLKLVVYYEDLNYENIVERPEIGIAQFVSDVGGAFGLWIGLSILSVFELFQLCVEMCDYGCHRCCKHQNGKRVGNKKKDYDCRDEGPNNINMNKLSRKLEMDDGRPQYGNKKQNYECRHGNTDYKNHVRRRSDEHLWNIWSRNQTDPAYLY